MKKEHAAKIDNMNKWINQAANFCKVGAVSAAGIIVAKLGPKVLKVAGSAVATVVKR